MNFILNKNKIINKKTNNEIHINIIKKLSHAHPSLIYTINTLINTLLTSFVMTAVKVNLPVKVSNLVTIIKPIIDIIHTIASLLF